jgi:hypothetical protein
MRVLYPFLLLELVLLSTTISSDSTEDYFSLRSKYGNLFSRSLKKETIYSSELLPLMHGIVKYFNLYPIECLIMVRFSSLPFKRFFWWTIVSFMVPLSRDYKLFSTIEPEEEKKLRKIIKIYIQKRLLKCFDDVESKEKEFQAIRLMIPMAEMFSSGKNERTENDIELDWEFALRNLRFDYEKKSICYQSFFFLFSSLIRSEMTNKQQDKQIFLLGIYIAIIVKNNCERIFETQFRDKPTLLLLILKLRWKFSLTFHYKNYFPIEFIAFSLDQIKENLQNFTKEVIGLFSSSISYLNRNLKFQKCSSGESRDFSQIAPNDRWIFKAIGEIEEVQACLNKRLPS